MNIFHIYGYGSMFVGVILSVIIGPVLIHRANKIESQIEAEKISNLYFKELTFYEIKQKGNNYIFGMVVEIMNKDFRRALTIDAIRYKGMIDYDQSKVGITWYSGTDFKFEGEVPTKHYLDPGGTIYVKIEIPESGIRGGRLGGLMKYKFDGSWFFVIGRKDIEVSPHKIIYKKRSIPNKEWNALYSEQDK